MDDSHRPTLTGWWCGVVTYGEAVATLVFFHAHPDDEALLTAGTMARAAAEGQRVVLVVATDGAAGLAASTYSNLAGVRSSELAVSAEALGVARTIWLGYGDSGLHGDRPAGPGEPATLCSVPMADAVEQLREVLDEERADVLVTYDSHGGYGHPDHVRCHEVAVAAAEAAGTPRVFEATVPRDLLLRGIRLASRFYDFPPEFDPTAFERAFTASADITHRVDVRRQLSAKRAAMAAHASQASVDGDGDRTLAAFLRFPKPLYRTVFGTEWYRQR
jgi:LmbE family N-acetylglucosaminyl deacetylase